LKIAKAISAGCLYLATIFREKQIFMNEEKSSLEPKIPDPRSFSRVLFLYVKKIAKKAIF